MMNSTQSLSLKQNIIWNSIGSFSYLFAQWLLTFLVVRLSDGFNDAGNLSLAISVTNIFYNLACFNVRPYLVSDISEKYSIDDYISFRIITSVFSFILCLGYSLCFNYTFDQYLCILIYMVFKLGEACVDIFHAIEQKSSRMDIGGVSLLCRGIITVFVFTISMIFCKNINISILLITVFTWIFILLFDFSQVKKFAKFKVKFNWITQKNLFFEFLPLAIGTFIGTTCTSLPRQFLEMIEGTNNLGVYATVATPAVIVQVASSYVYNPLLVQFSKFKAMGNQKGFKNLFYKTVLVIIGLGIVALVGSAFFAKWGLTLLYGLEISSYSYLFLPIIVYTALNGLLWFCHNILIIFRKMSLLLLINITGLIFCLISSFPLIKILSMNGVTICMIGFTVLMIIEMLLFINKEIKKIHKII